MKSMHLPRLESKKSGAIDLGIYIPGVNVWKMNSVYHLYENLHAAAQKAAREIDLNIRSGVCWDNLNTDKDFYNMLYSYRMRKHQESIDKNRICSPFFDGPHFELLRSEYPSLPLDQCK